MIRTNVIKYAFKRYRDKKEGKPGDKNHMKLMRNLKAIVQVKKYCSQICLCLKVYREISANKINTPFEITVNQCKRAISEKKFDTIATIRKKMSDVSARITKLEVPIHILITIRVKYYLGQLETN